MQNNKTGMIFPKENHGSYKSLLFDKRWKDFRIKILMRDNHKCVICQSVEKLAVHHKQYHFSEMQKTFKKPWEYNESLLITLCEECHNYGHRKYKVPVKYIK